MRAIESLPKCSKAWRLVAMRAPARCFCSGLPVSGSRSCSSGCSRHATSPRRFGRGCRSSTRWRRRSAPMACSVGVGRCSSLRCSSSTKCIGCEASGARRSNCADCLTSIARARRRSCCSAAIIPGRCATSTARSSRAFLVGCQCASKRRSWRRAEFTSSGSAVAGRRTQSHSTESCGPRAATGRWCAQRRPWGQTPCKPMSASRGWSGH